MQAWQVQAIDARGGSTVIGVRRSSKTQLDGRDAERPDVHLGVVMVLAHHFGGHELRGADERLAGRSRIEAGRTRAEDGRDAKVGEQDGAVLVDEQVACFDVTVDPAARG